MASAAGDVNGDGHPDVLCSAGAPTGGTSSIEVFEGSPLGIRPAGSVSGSAGFGVAAVGIGDRDGDGLGDVLIGDPAAAEVRLYRGSLEDGDADGTPASSDCDDADPLIGLPLAVYEDRDEDGFGSDLLWYTCDVQRVTQDMSLQGGDCDDREPAVHPHAVEVVEDGTDSDCDGRELCHVDVDLDGYRTIEPVPLQNLNCGGSGRKTDCDDSSASVHPGASEIAGDGLDADCDGQEICFTDGDGVGAGPIALAALDCAGAAPVDGDCDDADREAYPGNIEVAADGQDGDCDGSELCRLDQDGDGFGGEGLVRSEDGDCADAQEAGDGEEDCDDLDAAVPAA